jgi:hypothetical protein
MTPERTIDLGRLNSLLWRYRPCLERFEFLLEVQKMVLATGRQEWQKQMADLFDEAADALNALDLEREVLLGDDLTLRDLADDVPDPWGPILTEQQVALETLTTRIADLRRQNATALTAGANNVGNLIESLLESTGQVRSSEAGPSYGSDGRTLKSGTTSAVFFDGKA